MHMLMGLPSFNTFNWDYPRVTEAEGGVAKEMDILSSIVVYTLGNGKPL